MKQMLEENAPWSQLVSLKNIALTPLADKTEVKLNDRLTVEPFLVPHRDEFSETVGFRIRSGSKTLIFIPDIDKWQKWATPLADVVRSADYLLIDGTFYADGEINRPMSEVPHPFVSETMDLLRSLPTKERAKVYFTHFNHSNPLVQGDAKALNELRQKGFRMAKAWLEVPIVTAKERIDKLLVAHGLAESRTKAHALVMAGVVLVNEKRVAKPSEVFPSDAVIRIKGDSPENKYVGRGGLKLEAALEAFAIDATGFACIDIGSSTGGFTDCLLKNGAARVVAIDVGTNQLVWSLRNDPRVEVRENTNARELTPGDFDDLFNLAVMDVSFISVTKILPAIFDILKPDGKLVVLIKPQFEVGRGEVGKGGIVRETEKHVRVVKEVNDFAAGLGFRSEGLIESPILGAEGNKEFLALYAR